MASGNIPKAYHSVVARGNQHNISGGHGFVEFNRNMVFTPQNSNPSTHRNPWDPDPSRLDAVGGKNRVFCVCFGKPMLPSVEEELQQWMEDNHVSVLELKSFADRMLKEVAIIPFKVIK